MRFSESEFLTELTRLSCHSDKLRLENAPYAVATRPRSRHQATCHSGNHLSLERAYFESNRYTWTGLRTYSLVYTIKHSHG